MHMFAEGGYFMGGMHFLWWMFWLLVVGGIVYYVWRAETSLPRSTRGTRRCSIEMPRARHESSAKPKYFGDRLDVHTMS